jgi:LPS O-antigen subunit length determinant protein (WzzB/FepE family)
MVTNSVMNQIHLGSRLPENLYLSEETYRKDTDTQASAVRDITKGLLGRDAIMEKIDQIQRSASIEVNPADELRQMLKAGRLTKADVNGIETLMMRNSPEDGLQGESTLWKLSQGITALAREADPRKAREMQEIAGELLSRK